MPGVCPHLVDRHYKSAKRRHSFEDISQSRSNVVRDNASDITGETDPCVHSHTRIDICTRTSNAYGCERGVTTTMSQETLFELGNSLDVFINRWLFFFLHLFFNIDCEIMKGTNKKREARNAGKRRPIVFSIYM